MNPVTQFYVQQARTGLSSYSGSKYQKGGGILSILARLGLPVLKFLGKQVATTGLGIASDLLEGDNFKDSARKQLKQSGKNMVNYAASRLSGGRRRRTRTRRRPVRRINVIRTNVTRRRRPDVVVRDDH